PRGHRLRVPRPDRRARGGEAEERLRLDGVARAAHPARRRLRRGHDAGPPPLAGVYGAAMTLRRSDVEFDEEQRNVLLDVIAAEAGRLARIVEDILSAGQLDANTLTLNLDRVEADTLAAEALQAARLRFAEAAFELTLDG